MSKPDIERLPDRRLKLAFFGTPEIAETILRALYASDRDDIVLVACQPDRPKGRGKKVIAPPVKQLAQSKGTAIIQPRKMKDGAVRERLIADGIELVLVAAFGRIVPKDVLDAPPHGFWNVHASLLPRHRGASPIQHAILCGDAHTGITLMKMTPGLDEGPMLLERSLAIGEEETAEALSIRLGALGAETLIEGLTRAKTEGLAIVPQDDDAATFAPLLEKKDGHLDFSADSAVAIARRVRGLTPWPGTFVRDATGQPLRILRVRAIASPDGSAAITPPGTIAEISPKGLQIQTAQGQLDLLEVQPAGKRPMPIRAFLNGAGRHLQRGAPFPSLAN